MKRIIFVFITGVMVAIGCQPAVTPTLAPTLAPTLTPTLAPTQTPLPTFTSTVSIEATQTAQAQATVTAQADATRTLQAQATATAQAQSTTRAQASTTAQAGATATLQAFIAGINAISDAAPGNPIISAEGTVNGPPKPGNILVFSPGLDSNNFDAQVEMINPADRQDNTWDYGFLFRYVRPAGYELVLNSNRSWTLFLIQSGAALGVNRRNITAGTVKNFDQSPNGSNTMRLFARGNSAVFFVNGEYIATLDVSAWQSYGSFSIATCFMAADLYPTVVLRWKNLTVKALP